MTFSKEFKEALSELPSKEKDKLILRLLKKDATLAKRLQFELVNTNSIDEQRKIKEERILNEVQRISDRFYSVGYLHVDVRYLSGEITEHVKVTKDKFGEASLNLLMLNKVLELNNVHIVAVTPGKARKFCVSVIARAFKIMLIINKLDTDFFIEFEDDLKLLGNLISDNHYLMDTAIRNGLDVNWLLKAEIPENIADIYKEIRMLGFLR